MDWNSNLCQSLHCDQDFTHCILKCKISPYVVDAEPCLCAVPLAGMLYNKDKIISYMAYFLEIV